MYYTLFSKKNKSVERESNIQKALSYYFSHEESIRAVAKRFEIHPSTFHGRLNGQHGPQMGRPSILSVEMETKQTKAPIQKKKSGSCSRGSGSGSREWGKRCEMKKLRISLFNSEYEKLDNLSQM